MADPTHLRRRLSRPAATLSLLVVIAACSDDPTLPMTPAPPADAIQDAANGENGNPFVFLKPPVVEAPSSSAFGTFNPSLHPIVEVCELGAGDVCTLLQTNDGTGTPARYTVDGGPGGEAVTVDLTAEEYQVQIHFSLFDLADNTTYRIVTRVGHRTLAFADVVVISPREMKSADTDNNIVFTNSMKTVPWKVRIDEGALCWEPGETVVSCTSSTVTVGDEETVTLTSSDGEEVDFHLPAGWTATVDGEPVTALTIAIEELPADNTLDDPTCFQNFALSDPTTGEPGNCYDVRADTDTQSDVTVEFGSDRPILSFCPDPDVLQQIANGAEGYVMTSVEQDVQGAVLRTYQGAAPPPDFGGCSLGTGALLGDNPVGRLAARVWQGLRPLMNPIIPAPLYAVDLGFGGELSRLGTIFFWSRTPTAITVVPSSTSVTVGQTAQYSAEPVFHEGATAGGPVNVQWASTNNSVATVDASGLVTGIGTGTTQIVATATDVLDPLGMFLTAAGTVTVTEALATLLEPTTGTVIQQNDPTIGCTLALQNGRGFGFQVFYDWTDVVGADSYEIKAGFPTATFPFLEATVNQSELLDTSCNTIAGTAEPAEWQVRPVTNGVAGPWSAVETFEFAQCLLEDGSLCFAGTAPIGFEVLPDGSSPTSGMSIATQYAGLGVVFDYTRFDQGPGTARICDSTSLSPTGVTSDHSVTFDDQTGGGANACSPATLGTIGMTVGVTTTAVEFRLAYPQLVTPSVSAASKAGGAITVQVVTLIDYTTQGGQLWREALYRVPGDVGSIAVTQSAGGGIMLIDEVHVQQ